MPADCPGSDVEGETPEQGLGCRFETPGNGPTSGVTNMIEHGPVGETAWMQALKRVGRDSMGFRTNRSGGWTGVAPFARGLCRILTFS
jgi:hypothetical protein